MRFGLITNTDNGVGLQKDAEILKGLLESWGHSAHTIHYKKQNQIEEAPPADVHIYMEVVNYNLVARKISKEDWFIPNPEWFQVCDHPRGLRNFSQILCKTQDAVRIFTKLAEFKPSVKYVGFESRDLYDPDIPRERKFFHGAGQSRYKNTMSVGYSFARMFQDEDVKPALTVVGAYPDEYAFTVGSPNVTTHQRVTDEEMKQLMNSHLFHVLPSGYEGWGHALNEGLGCGAVMLTTAHPPMCEFDGVPQNLLIPYQDTIPELAATRARVVAAPIRDAVKKALRMKPEEVEQIQKDARSAFLKQRDDFRNNLKSIVEAL